MENSQELPLCPICCDLLGRNGGPSTLPCGHNGCLNCFLDVRAHNPCCPLCRTPFDPAQQLTLNHGLRDLISMATSIYMDDSTRDEGWEAFPTAKLTREHYAQEVVTGRQQQLGQPSLPGLATGCPPQHQQPPAFGSTTSSIFSSSSIAGAHEFHPSGRGGSRAGQQQQHQQQLGLPQSAPSSARELLLMEAPVWVPDSCASHCCGCQLPFKAVLRPRHHCRLCGKVFCTACSAKELLLPPRFKERSPRRVCDMCAELLLPLQGFLVGATAASVQPPVHDALDAVSLRSWLNSPWGGTMAGELYKAANILRSFNQSWRPEPELGLPPSLLAGGLRGIALLSVIRLGAGWAATAGTGIVIARQRDGGWSAPCAAACCGLGWGLQLGGGLTDVVLLLRSEEALRAFASGQTLGLGGSAGLAVGPLGRVAEASWRAGGLRSAGAVAGYSCSKGAFAGVSLDGSLTVARDALNKAFYGYPVSPRQLLLDGCVPRPPAASLLYTVLDEFTERWENRGLLTASTSASSSSSKVADKAAAGKASSSKLGQAAAGTGVAASGSSAMRGPGVQRSAAAVVNRSEDLFDIDTFERLEAEEDEAADYECEECVAPSAPPLLPEPDSDRHGSSRWWRQQQEEQEEEELPSAPRTAVVMRQDQGEEEEEEEQEYALEW